MLGDNSADDGSSDDTELPSSAPSVFPSQLPSNLPTYFPTTLPSYAPTVKPTLQPTMVPTLHPTPRCDGDMGGYFDLYLDKKSGLQSGTVVSYKFFLTDDEDWAITMGNFSIANGVERKIFCLNVSRCYTIEVSSRRDEDDEGIIWWLEDALGKSLSSHVNGDKQTFCTGSGGTEVSL